jgi:hypothetical protein
MKNRKDNEVVEGLRMRVAELEAEAAEHVREWDILEGACTFWKDTAVELGYEE